MSGPSLLHSLRGRYFLASTIIACLLLVTILFADRHVSRTTYENSLALNLSNRVVTALDQVRADIRLAENGLNDLLSDGQGNGEAVVKHHLASAIRGVQVLYGDHQLRELAWFDQVEALNGNINLLGSRIEQLLQQRTDPNWVYPAMPLIAGTMLDAVHEFEGQLDLALEEVEGQIRQPGQIELFQQLVELRGLWRRLILDFRIRMINFAGLSAPPAADSDPELDQTYELVRIALDRLAANPTGISYGLVTEESIAQMPPLARRWHSELKKVQGLRASNLWRGDIRHVETDIRPLQRALEEDLHKLEQQVMDWSGGHSVAAGEAATRISLVLWVISGLSLLVVVLIYVLLDRGVLRPVTHVAKALHDQASGEKDILLPEYRHHEMSMLVNAFTQMREQIQSRQQALEHQALHDELTGLPNRSLLHDRLIQGLKQSIREGHTLGLLFLDLNRFKEINDSLGHHIGDLMLQQVAARLQKLLRESDTVARLGGDEFAIILPHLDKEAAAELAERINAELESPFRVAGNTLYLGASIGITIAPGDGQDADTLIRRADSAMYRAKRSNRYFAFYDREQDQASARILQLAGELRSALRDNTLAIHYQPRLALPEGEIVGAEALLRWRKKDGEIIPPELAVRVAEHTNQIRELTRWVLDRVLSDCASCRHEGWALNVSINLSARDFDDPTLPEQVWNALVKHQVHASQLTLEITENAVMADPENTRDILEQLAEMGLTLSIDDFGTGFSSLAHLKHLPVHELKIDKSFVINMMDNESDLVIVRSTIDLGHNLDLRVVAEGVETEDVLDRLRGLGCDLIQGHLVGPPLPLQRLLSLMARPQATANPIPGGFERQDKAV